MSGFITISLQNQTLLFQSGEEGATRTYSISTAKNGAGEVKGSFKTPTGEHTIRAKIGEGLPAGAVLKGRRFTGEIYDETLEEQYLDHDWVLTRILWLSGLEVGKNRLGSVDTMSRYIYIHGTPDTNPMGHPLSHGCIRMRNCDIIELYDLCSVGDFVLIQA